MQPRGAACDIGLEQPCADGLRCNYSLGDDAVAWHCEEAGESQLDENCFEGLDCGAGLECFGDFNDLECFDEGDEPTGIPCQSRWDCARGQLCLAASNQKSCVARCQSDADCPPGSSATT